MPSPFEIDMFKHFFKRLEGGWEVKISGGEPFIYPRFLEVVEWLMESGMTVSVVTNFSAPKRVIKKFLRITGSGLRSFSASLHRERVHWPDFLKKCLWLTRKLRKYPNASLVVNSVVQPGKAHELIEIKQAFESEGIRFYPQLMRKKGKPLPYSPEEKEIIKEMAADKDPFKINAGFSMKGKTCYAGINYFIISPEGKCFSCYPGKRDETGYLGSIADNDFAFRPAPLVCPYDICPCTVPINRGMIV